MTKKELIASINNNEVKSVEVKFDSYSDDINIKCKLGKLRLRSFDSYEEIRDLLLEKGFTKGNDYYNSNNIFFIKRG